MNVSAIRTKKVRVGDTLFSIFPEHLPAIPEKSILVVTSKIVSICEGRVVLNDGSTSKHDLAIQEAQYLYEDDQTKRYNLTLTIARNTLIASAGVDESNGDNHFVLWPENPHASATSIWEYLKKTYSLASVGVLITDSHHTPLRWGATGFALAWCGFFPLKNYIGSPDIFGRPLTMTQSSLIDGLASAAVLVMGEGNEQTPLALITDPPVEFVDRPPSETEISSLEIDPEDDIYAPLLTRVPWKLGKKR